VSCPYTGETLATVPALNPDLTIVHAQRADPRASPRSGGCSALQKGGGVRFAPCHRGGGGAGGRIGHPSRSQSHGDPGLIVDAVVVEPWGAHPSYAQGYYDRDNQFYVAWEKISRDPAALDRYLPVVRVGSKGSGRVCREVRGSGTTEGVTAGVVQE
jgi:glutaconate CoA-transferase subunit A